MEAATCGNKDMEDLKVSEQKPPKRFEVGLSMTASKANSLCISILGKTWVFFLQIYRYM